MDDPSIELYYTPPSNTAFKDIKACAIDLWNTYDNTYHYVDEKVNKIKDIENVKDNFMYIFAMFDFNNQRLLLHQVEPETRKAVFERLPDDGPYSDFKLYFKLLKLV